MRRTLAVSLVSLLGLVWWVPPTIGQTYDPGPLPTAGPIHHETVIADGWPTTRTDIGIGEQVWLWVDAAEFEDTDYEIDEYGGETPVQDSMGQATWDITGPVLAYPTTGTEVLITADEYEGTITIVAWVQDSGTMGVDPAVQAGGAGGALGVNVHKPSGIVCTAENGVPGQGWQSGTANFGASGNFLFQITPNAPTASFKGRNFRFSVPQQSYTWNDSPPATSTIAAETIGPGVAYTDPTGQWNFISAQFWWGRWPVSHFNGKDLPPTGDYNFNMDAQFESPPGSNTYVTFGSGITWHDKARISDSKAQIGMSPGAGGGTIWTSFMGPWQ